MASTEHKNRRRALALERLNLAVARLAKSRNLQGFEIPKKMRDNQMHEIISFERIADFLEALGGDSLPKLEDNPIVIKQANRAAKPIANKKTKPVGDKRAKPVVAEELKQ